MAIDPARLRRAVALDSERLPAGGWIVAGRYVDPLEGCGCEDRMYRGVVCKHELRARLDPLDSELLEALTRAMEAE